MSANLIGDVLSRLPRCYMADKLGLHVEFAHYLASVALAAFRHLILHGGILPLRPTLALFVFFSHISIFFSSAGGYQ